MLLARPGLCSTDAPAVWRLTDTSRRNNTTGAGVDNTDTQTKAPPVWERPPRVEAIPYAPPQIWTTRTIRTTSERERTARVSHSKRRTPQSLNTAKGRKAPPARKKYTRRGRAILFVSKEGEQKRQKQTSRRGDRTTPERQEENGGRVEATHNRKRPPPPCGDYTTANKRPPPFAGDGRNQRINSINLISNSLFTQRQR